jgi:hypothetical protein
VLLWHSAYIDQNKLVFLVWRIFRVTFKYVEEMKLVADFFSQLGMLMARDLKLAVTSDVMHTLILLGQAVAHILVAHYCTSSPHCRVLGSTRSFAGVLTRYVHWLL